jgi:trimeric autotransporter adhesin
MLKILAGFSFFLALSLSIAAYATASEQNRTGLASLPADAQSSISAALGHDLPGYGVRARGASLEAENALQKLTVDFTATGVRFHTSNATSNATWKMALRGYGRGSDMQTVAVTAPQASGNRVEYGRGSVTEWYVNGPLGVEQGFTLSQRPISAAGSPAGMKPLTIALALSGDLTASVDRSGKGLTMTGDKGQPQLRYGGLSASDASGKQLRTWMEIQGGELLLKVEDAGARYPIVVDPFVQLAKLTASDPSKLEFLGVAVAISGNTVAVGIGSTHVQGAVYIFEKPTSGWSNVTQTAKLTASDGVVNDYLGYSVAISGNTIVSGAPNANSDSGAAYVFVKPVSGWSDMTETADLIPSGVHQGFGSSVAVSGNTAVVGSTDYDVFRAGAIFVYEKPATGWASMTQTATLTPSDGHNYDAFGSAVAMSGNTIVAIGRGKGYVFLEPSGGWVDMTQTGWLVVPSGSSFSVSTDGNTVVTGNPYATINSKYAQGAAYVFVKPTGGWGNATPVATLTASDGAASDEFGYGVAVSGSKIATGAPFAAVGSNAYQGAAYAFIKPSTGWKTTSHFDSKVVASDGASGDELGWSVSISGSMLLVGAPGAITQHGAVYIFQR